MQEGVFSKLCKDLLRDLRCNLHKHFCIISTQLIIRSIYSVKTQCKELPQKDKLMKLDELYLQVYKWNTAKNFAHESCSFQSYSTLGSNAITFLNILFRAYNSMMNKITRSLMDISNKIRDVRFDSNSIFRSHFPENIFRVKYIY